MKDYKKLIDEKGIKQRWLAKQMGISFEVLNKWINGKVHIPIKRETELDKLLK